ncbi:hypothetical protein [Streptomyces sp. NPDC001389]|uniref:hypothetical protein n=1 Tax=Streptomyces sp. NPDC001389 TaxID=3364569 RepID=UPI00367CBDA3
MKKRLLGGPLRSVAAMAALYALASPVTAAAADEPSQRAAQTFEQGRRVTAAPGTALDGLVVVTPSRNDPHLANTSWGDCRRPRTPENPDGLCD